MATKERYDFRQSPFFRLSSRKRAAELLAFDLADVDSLVGEGSYHVFVNDKGRTIQHPQGALSVVHKKIATLLARLAAPSYVRSVKGESYISNTGAHCGRVPLIKTDISKFYPSTKFSAVYDLFHRRFECSPDVAYLLATLSCFKGKHLPTGSYLSGSLAFFSHEEMFQQIHDLAVSHGCQMTCYVDDIVISGERATKALLYQVRGVVRKHGLSTKDDKSKTFSAHKPKIVTGVVLSADGLRLPNSRHKMIHETRKALRLRMPDAERTPLLASLRGRLQEAKQIETWNADHSPALKTGSQ
ncbi:reverse transcriptase family protein [Paraburkholderia adhaesiva]|uniref:reverse transcriptase family protein n=1 Tax=Paraburkholderia adhaesiva TaxID=2883244 RepID=UPI001F1877DE|nr:reverse transcriptase family protein [Paraburkholderia adhaesiva]